MSSKLFSPFQLKSLTLKNRIVVSPMCQYSSEDGFANDWHLVHLGSRAVGGAALIISEATAVSPEGRISPQDLGIYKDEHVSKLKQITEFIESQVSIPGIQLAHAGRKASVYTSWLGKGQVPEDKGGWQTVSASPIPFNERDHAPLQLDLTGIQKVISDFRIAAERALKAGFKVIEIHAAHGYLVHQFLSPLSNKRADEYGGSFENRIRLLLEIIDAIKTVWPAELPLIVRLSATDWVDNGWDADQSVQLASVLVDKGIDLVDVSSGGLVSYAKISVGPSYQVPFSARIKQETAMKTGSVGMITEAHQAEGILENGEADLIVIAREFIRDPYFPFKAAADLGDDLQWPVQYERGKPARK